MKLFARAPFKFGAGLFTCLFIAVALLLLAPATPAHAQETTPNVAVITRTVELATTTAWITVPVTLTTGGTGISAVGFVLDYDQSCVRIDDVETDVTGLPDDNGFLFRRVNDADSGELEIAVWDSITPLNALPTGNLMEVKFALEAACRTGANQDIAFGFTIQPATTFGDINGSPVAGAAYTGTYTLDINQNPTGISFNPSNVDENVTTGDREIGTLSAPSNVATDAEGDPLTFALTTGCVITYTNDGFSIAADAPLKLRTSRTFNYEANPDYQVCVQANDDRGGTFSDVITVTVADKNDDPTFLSLTANTLPEGTADGSEEIGVFETEDEDFVETFNYTFEPDIVTLDNGDFTILGNKLMAKDDAIYDYDTKAIYKIRVLATDSVDVASTIEQTFTVQIVGESVLILPNEPEVPYVVSSGFVTVPIRYNAMGNDVVTATFAVTYSDSCLNYTGLSGLQSGFDNVGVADVNDTSPVTVSIASTTTSVLREGVIGYLSFQGGTCGDGGRGNWTDLIFGETTLQAAGDAAVTSTTSNGKLVVIPNDTLGDCNRDAVLNAGDFTAIALESFDTTSELATSTSPTKLAPLSWLWSPLGTYTFSAKGCDANVDRILDVADITCAARTFFGATCTAARSGRTQSAQIAAPASLVAAPGSAVAAPVILTANGNAIAAAAFTMQIDPALVFDATDADDDGVPDAVSFNTPAGFFKMVLYDAPTRRLQVLVAGLVMPLPVLPDGAFATIQLQGAASADGGATPLVLSDVSLGGVDGNAVEVVVAPIGMANRIFLPSVKR